MGWHPRDRVRRGKFSDEFWCGDPSRGEAPSGGDPRRVPRRAARTPAASRRGGEDAAAGGGPDGAGQRQRDNPRRTVGHTGRGREPLRPGSPPPGGRLVLSPGRRHSGAAALGAALGLVSRASSSPALPCLGEDTRGAREWRGHTDIKGIFGAVSGICQGDGERTDGEILLPVFPALSGLY